MSRAKIQFSESIDSERLWKMVQYLQDSYFKADQREFDKKLEGIKLDFPNATVTGSIKPMSAGDVVFQLVENEAYKNGYCDD